jgi:hypothetical protein
MFVIVMAIAEKQNVFSRQSKRHHYLVILRDNSLPETYNNYYQLEE